MVDFRKAIEIKKRYTEELKKASVKYDVNEKLLFEVCDYLYFETRHKRQVILETVLKYLESGMRDKELKEVLNKLKR